MISKLSVTSFIFGLISGIYTIITCLTLFVIYLSDSFGFHPFGSMNAGGFKYFIIFSIWWIYLAIWCLIFIACFSVTSIICGSIDLLKIKSRLSEPKRKKLNITSLLLALSPLIVIGIYFIPSVSSLISEIPG